MALHPFEADPPLGHGRVDPLDDLEVLDGLPVALPPATTLPARHPLRDRVDDVGAVADDDEVVVDAGGLLEQVQDGGELANVVGAVRPATAGPAVGVEVPGPAGGSGVAER